MKTLMSLLLSALLFGLAWAQDTATLTIFNSNDIKGYLEPCG
jgi:hypothetical protein